ncbi:MAG TPA: DUF6356 family protein [Stellaceae bacterium]|nr:DUF6356 family protein [Stellaceae bacterium]
MAAEMRSVVQENAYLHPDKLCDEFVPGEVIGASAGLVLRYARDDDAAAIIALISAVWSEYPGKTLVAANDMPELLRPASAYAAYGGRFWVVEAGFPQPRIIGTVALQPSAEPGVVELQKLYVARSMRRNGLGGFLCQLVEREARRRGAHAVELWSDIKLLDAHRRYQQLGYERGEMLKSYNDTSGTVRYYYRKTLEPQNEPSRIGSITAPRQARDRWHELLDTAADGRVLPGDTMNRLSFTDHPASVGETYFEHLRTAGGFAAKMIRGGFACLVHALLPFLFTHTGSGVVAELHTKMVTSRRRRMAPRAAADETDKRRASAA